MHLAPPMLDISIETLQRRMYMSLFIKRYHKTDPETAAGRDSTVFSRAVLGLGLCNETSQRTILNGA